MNPGHLPAARVPPSRVAEGGRARELDSRPVPLPVYEEPASAIAMRLLARAKDGRTAGGHLTALRVLNTGMRADWTTALFGEWARVQQVLMFYCDRIADDGYLDTTRDTAAVARLRELLGAIPDYPYAATTDLAFTLSRQFGGGPAIVPRGTSVLSRPSSTGISHEFEVRDDLECRGEWSAMEALVPTRQQRQAISEDTASIKLDGVGLKLMPGDWLLIEGRRDGREIAKARVVSTIKRDTKGRWTQVMLEAEPPAFMTGNSNGGLGGNVPPLEDTRVTVLRPFGRPLGHDARSWRDVPDATREHLSRRRGGVLAIGPNGESRGPEGKGLPPGIVGVFARMDSVRFAGSKNAGLWMLGDNDAWWTRCHGLPRKGTPTGLQCDPQLGLLAVESQRGCYRSFDGGKTWESMGRRLYRKGRLPWSKFVPSNVPAKMFQCVTTVATRKNGHRRKILLGTDAGVFETVSPAEGWRPMSKGLPGWTRKSRVSSTTVLAITVSMQHRVLVGTTEGLFWKNADGHRWERCRVNGSGSAHDPAHRVSACASTRVAVALGKRWIRRSIDGGVSWSPMPNLDMAVDALVNDDGRIWALTPDSLWSWNEELGLWSEILQGFEMPAQALTPHLDTVDVATEVGGVLATEWPGFELSPEPFRVESKKKHAQLGDWVVVIDPSETPPTPRMSALKHSLKGVGASQPAPKELACDNPDRPMGEQIKPSGVLSSGVPHGARDEAILPTRCPAHRRVLSARVSASVLTPTDRFGRIGPAYELTLAHAEPIRMFSRRESIVLTDAEQLRLYEPQIPLPGSPVAGDRVVIEKAIENPLPAGRAVFVRGQRAHVQVLRSVTAMTGSNQCDLQRGDCFSVLGYSKTDGGLESWKLESDDGLEMQVRCEAGTLEFQPPPRNAEVICERATVARCESSNAQANNQNDHGSVVLCESLRHVYASGTAEILGNIATAWQGRTIQEEVLGDGDASRASMRVHAVAMPWYNPVLDHSVPSLSLDVRVDGVKWERVDSFLNSAPNDRVYRLENDPNGGVAVVFGDSVCGQRPPTGRDNVRASYRTATPDSGFLPSGSVALLRTHPYGVTAVFNPMAIPLGVQHAASPVSTQATHAVQTDRIQSLDDYVRLVRESDAVVEATADHIWNGTSFEVLVTVAFHSAIPASTRSILIGSFCQSLSDAGADRRGLRLIEAEELTFDASLRLSELGMTGAAQDVRRRILGEFSPDSRRLAEPMPAAELLAIALEHEHVQGVSLENFGLTGSIHSTNPPLIEAHRACWDPSGKRVLAGQRLSVRPEGLIVLEGDSDA